jgi:hypothetical protein
MLLSEGAGESRITNAQVVTASGSSIAAGTLNTYKDVLHRYDTRVA